MNRKCIADVFWDSFDRQLEKNNESVSHFEKANGIQSGRIAQFKKRQSIPSGKVIEKFCKYFNIYFDEMFWEVEE